MTEIPDDIRQAFAELTGRFEDASAIAACGQSVRTRSAAMRQTARLAASLRKMRALLDRIEERLR